MNQQKNLVGSSQDTNSTKKPVFLKISPKKETLISNISIVGSNPNKNVISIKKSNLIGSSTSSVSVVESIYRKSAAMIGVVFETASTVFSSSVLKNVVQKGMLNDLYFPSQKYETGLEFTISPIPPKPEPIDTGSEIFTYFDIPGIELVRGEHKSFLHGKFGSNLSVQGGEYKKYIEKSVIYISSRLDYGKGNNGSARNKTTTKEIEYIYNNDNSKNDLRIIDSLISLNTDFSSHQIGFEIGDVYVDSDFSNSNVEIIDSNISVRFDGATHKQLLFDSELNFVNKEKQNQYQTIDGNSGLLIKSEYSLSEISIHNSFESKIVESSTEYESLHISDLFHSENGSISVQNLTDSFHSVPYYHFVVSRTNLQSSTNNYIKNDSVNKESLTTSELFDSRVLFGYSYTNTTIFGGDSFAEDNSKIVENLVLNLKFSDAFLNKSIDQSNSNISTSDSNVSLFKEISDGNISINRGDILTWEKDNSSIRNMIVESSIVGLSDLIGQNTSIQNGYLFSDFEEADVNVSIIDSDVSDNLSDLFQSNVSIESSSTINLSDNVVDDISIESGDIQMAQNFSSGEQHTQIVDNEYYYSNTPKIETNLTLSSGSLDLESDNKNSSNIYIGVFDDCGTIKQADIYLNSNITIYSSSYTQIVFTMDSTGIKLDSDYITWDNDFYPDPI